MFYKNVSFRVKTFYGIEFKPGETKEVHNYINDDYMIAVPKPAPQKAEKKHEVAEKVQDVVEPAPAESSKKPTNTKEEKVDVTDNN